MPYIGMQNEYKTIEAYPGYKFYNDGKIIGTFRDGEREINHFPRTAKMYPSVNLRREDGSFKMEYVHRIVAMLFVENPDPNTYTIVDHKDRNPLNSHHSNLRFVNHSINGFNRDDTFDYGTKSLVAIVRAKGFRPSAYAWITRYVKNGMTVEDAIRNYENRKKKRRD